MFRPQRQELLFGNAGLQAEMIFVQIIHNQWSKASRGAPLSTKRNQVPLALPMDTSPATDPESCLVNYIAFSESDKFSAPVFEVTRTHEELSVVYKRVLLRPHGLNLHLPHSSLFPEKNLASNFELVGGYAFQKIENRLLIKQLNNHEFLSDAAWELFQLQMNEWGTIQWNQRFGLLAGSVYEQFTINISFSDKFENATFLNTKPKYKHIRLKDLW